MAAVALSLGGCVTVDIKSDPAAGRPAATYDSGLSYLITARAALLTRAQHRERFDDATKAGVGVGVVGAGASSVFHSGVNPILGFLTFGAINYALNGDVNPAALDAVYRAGVSNLDCIRTSAVLADQNISELSPQLTSIKPQIDIAIKKVVSDIVTANGDATYALDVDQAIRDVKSAQEVSREIDNYISTVQIGEQIVSGVNSTLTAVNAQALARNPSIDSILQRGSSISSAMDTGIQLDAKLQAAIVQLQAKPQANGAEKIHFAQDRAALKALIELIPDLSLGAQLAAIGECHAQFAALQPVTVSPNPVALTAGGATSLKLTGNPPFYVQWDTGQPQNVHVDSGLQVSLSADSGAATGSAVFHVVDKLGTPSDSVTLNVTSSTPLVKLPAPKKAPAGPPPPPAGR